MAVLRYARPRQVLTRFKWRRRSIRNRLQGRRTLHFLHLGKTGGTALKYVLRNNAYDDGLKIYLHGHRFRLRDVPRRDLVFFFVRDPVSRFVSAFHSRQQRGRPAYFFEWSKSERTAFEEFKTPNELAEALSCHNPDKRTRAETAMRQISHVRDSYWDWFRNPAYFRSRASGILFIGFQERLTEDFEILKPILGLPHDASLPEDATLAHRSPTDVDRSLTSQAVANLEKWYADDIRFVEICKEMRAT